ncbi:MAG: VanZ family protein [Candidatus Lindowbacteria bacterium]|nr:VanZ family protein [Candidatus Lindowbacteria bacterium]
MPFLIATIAYCSFLFYLSSIPSFPVPPPFPYFDKLVHFCLFGGLSATLAVGLHRARHEYNHKTLFVVPVVFSAFYGLSDEIHQVFVPGRTFAVSDIAADALGSAAAVAFLLFVYHVKNNRPKTSPTIINRRLR